MPESYQRGNHEAVLEKRDNHTLTLEALNADATSPEDIAYLGSLKIEQTELETEHHRLLDRAHGEALLEHNRRSITPEDRAAYESTSENWKNKQTEAYENAKGTFSQTIVRSREALERGLEKEIETESILSEVGLINIKPWQDNSGLMFFDVTLSFSKYNGIDGHGDKLFTEESHKITLTEAGEILTGWDSLPPLGEALEPNPDRPGLPLSLLANPEGKGALLNEMTRVFEELGYPSTPRIVIEDDLVLSEQGEANHQIPNSNSLVEGVDTSFAATERFLILESYQPTFVCATKREGRQAYSAFVYEDVIIFDSLRYGNGIYFMKIEPTLSRAELYDTSSIDEVAQNEAMEQVLKRVGFYEEIKKTRTERKEAGNRFPAQHPPRTKDPKDKKYQEKLNRYYESLFKHVRGQVTVDQANGTA